MLLAAILASGGNAVAQDSVIKKTTDESGFEKQLTEIDMAHQTANQLMSAGQWEKAVAELVKVVAAEADRIAAWQDLAKCYNELKDYEQASGAYMAAHKLQPGDLDMLSNLGYAQLRATQLEGAVETYGKMLELDSVNYDANVHLGFIHQKQGEEAKAVPYYEKALEARDDDVATMGSLAKAYAETGEEAKADAMYEKAIEFAEPEQKKQLLSRLGKSGIDAKNWEKAAAAYAQLVEIEPDSPANQYNLGISLMQAKQPQQAAVHLAETVALKPDYVQAYQYLAQCYNKSKRYNDAIATVRKALPLAENKAGLYCAWGSSLEKLEMFDEAIDKFQLALNDPQYGGYAKKQIQRQEDLKKRAKMMRDR